MYQLHSKTSRDLAVFDQEPQDYIIFASNTLGADNWNQINIMLEALHIPYKPLQGSYEGVQENSWLINRKHFEKFRALCPVVTKEEESFLILEDKDLRNRYKASLLFQETGEIVELGRLQSVSKDRALKEKAWTYDPETNTYYITVSENHSGFDDE